MSSEEERAVPEAVRRVVASTAAREFLAELKADSGALLFHQSGGCCDGSSPMCYPADGFRIGPSDTLLGVIDDVPVYIGRSQGAAWAHTQLILDVVPGRGGMFSLDNGREKRFLTRGRVFTPAEVAALNDPRPPVERDRPDTAE